MLAATRRMEKTLTSQPNLSPILFADSISPQLIPDTFTHVAAYWDGLYQWPTELVDRFPRHIEIGVKPHSPAQAFHARVLDIERYDATAPDFLPFANTRHQNGHSDATAYSSLDGIPAIAKVMGDRSLPWVVWPAWFTNTPVPPSRADVLAEIKRLTGYDLPASRLWACQWKNGADWDTSVLYGADDFTSR